MSWSHHSTLCPQILMKQALKHTCWLNKEMSECDKTGSPFKQPTVDAGGVDQRGQGCGGDQQELCSSGALEQARYFAACWHYPGAHAALTQPSSCRGPVCLSAPTGLSSVRTATRFFSYCQLHSRFLTSVWWMNEYEWVALNGETDNSCMILGKTLNLLSLRSFSGKAVPASEDSFDG